MSPFHFRALMMLVALVGLLGTIGLMLGVCGRIQSTGVEPSGVGTEHNPAASDLSIPAKVPQVSDVSAEFTNKDGVRFSLRLPPGWEWHEGESYVIRHGDWNVATMKFDSQKASDADSAQIVAERYMASLDTEAELDARSNKTFARVQDRRIIEVSGTPAVWDVVTGAPDPDEAPSTLYTTCFLRCGDRNVEIWCTLTDLRTRRTHQEFAARVAECLLIVRSLHIDVSLSE